MEKKTIRILHVVAKMQLGGTETLLMTFYRQINRELVQFDFAVTAKEEAAYDKEILELGGRIYRYPRYYGWNHRAYVRWWHRFFEEHPEYHIIHGHIGYTAATYLHIAKRYGCYAIAHSHSTNEVKTLRNLWKKRTLSDIAHRVCYFPSRYVADYFFGCSRQALIDRYGKKVARNSAIASVLNNAIDAQRFIYNEADRATVRWEYSLAEDDFVIGTVGRLTTHRNPAMVIDIVSQLVKRGIKFKFLWIGQGQLEQEIKAEIKRHELEDYILLPGARKDIHRVLSAMDVFILPSLWEGLGIACIEAQAAGLPTLCSESVPVDAKITDLFHYLPLDNASKWADEIVRQKGVRRSNRYMEVVHAGYDVKTVAKWLQEFYIQKYPCEK